MDPVCNGRLTLEEDVPLSVSDQFNKTVVYFVPYKGNEVALYNAKGRNKGWSPTAIPEDCSLTVPGTTNLPFDIFVYYDAEKKEPKSGKTKPGKSKPGTGKYSGVTLDYQNWTNGTTRYIDVVPDSETGVLVKNGDPTRRYLGTGRTTGTSGKCEDSARKRFLWNYYHRDKRLLQVVESLASWTSTVTTWEPANAAGTTPINKVEAVIGYREANLDLTVTGSAKCGATAGHLAVAIGQDSSSPTGDCIGRGVYMEASKYGDMRAHLTTKPIIGYHYWQWLQIGPSGTKTWYGTDTGGNVVHKNGITGWIEG